MQQIDPLILERCHLTISPTYEITDRYLAAHVRNLFQKVADATGAALSRYDLFHGHVLRRGGSYYILFHIAEYPAIIDQGYCTRGSRVEYRDDRNILYSLSTGDITLLTNTDHPIGTVYEGDIGTPLYELYYIEGIAAVSPRGSNIRLNRLPSILYS